MRADLGSVLLARRASSLIAALALYGCVITSDEGSGSSNGGTAAGGASSVAGANAVGTSGGSTGRTSPGGATNAGTPGGTAGQSMSMPGGMGGEASMSGGSAGDSQNGMGGEANDAGTGGEPSLGGMPGCSESPIMEGITEAHNAVRDTVEPPNNEPLPPLEWSCEVAEVAQAYAEELAATMNCDLVHSSGDYGENLYWSSGFEPTVDDVVEAWASEAPCYSYDVFPDQCSEVPGQCDICGHYTQIVWRNTSHVGCGMARCGDAQVWVCNYDPPGNYINQYPY